MKVCNFCGMPVVLVPSAEHRARQFGGKAKHYIDLFPNHAACELDTRKKGDLALMRRKQDDVKYVILTR